MGRAIMVEVVTTNKRIVSGKGPLDCKIAFVGEALGAQEERLGEPFVGPAGQLLNDLLNIAGIIRSKCYITNVVKEKPYRNDIKQFIDLSKKVPKATPAYLNYLSILKEELERCKANVIVAVGAVPMYALTGLKQITKRRGSIYESTLVPGRKVIPIIHPSAALRQYMFRHYILYDLVRIKEESDYSDIILPEREITLQPSYMQVMEFLALCSGKQLVAFDIETQNEEISCMSFAYSFKDVICIPFMHGGTDYFAPDQEVAIWKASAVILENSNIKKVAQNAVFDFSFIAMKYGICIRNIEDTMVAQGVAFPDLPKGLDFLTSIYTKEPYYKDIGRKAFKDT
jgi:DNA polymerase